MAQLLVRKLDDSIVSTLKKQAAKNGRSVEEEHRLILREALIGIPASMKKMSLEAYLVADPSEDIELPLSPKEYPPTAQTI